jgi:hypothetical protein
LLTVSILVAVVAGCANVQMQRAKVEKFREVELVRVVTPPLEAPSFMQAWDKSGTGGLVQAAIAASEPHVQLSPRNAAIPDFGDLVATKLLTRLPARAEWFPKLDYQGDAVHSAYVVPGKAWLRLEVFNYHLAPPPMRTVTVGVEVSLRDERNQRLWVQRKIFSGLVHGGKKIEMDEAKADPAQLGRELDRAAEWLSTEIASEVR